VTLINFGQCPDPNRTEFYCATSDSVEPDLDRKFHEIFSNFTFFIFGCLQNTAHQLLSQCRQRSTRLIPIVSTMHELINYKDTRPKCRLYWCLIEFIDWRYSQSCWYFWPSFVTYCPFCELLPPFSCSLPTSPPSQSQSILYTDSVWLGWGGGGGVELCWRPYSAGV
jgi:hypothetical protein